MVIPKYPFPQINFIYDKMHVPENNTFDELFLQPYLLPGEKKLFYKYLEHAHTYFEFGSGGFTHQAAKKGLKIYSVEISDSWHFLLKNEFQQIREKMKNFKELNIDITYLLVELQGNAKVSKNELHKYVSIYNHTKYKADYVVINGLYPISCTMNLFSQINFNTTIFLHNLQKNQNTTITKAYFDILEQSDRSFILKKKEGNHFLSPNLLKKIENDEFKFKNKKIVKVSQLNNNFHYIVEKYKYSNNSESVRPKTNNIWIFWFQGFDNDILPPIVKICIKCLKNNFKYGNITFISKENYLNYAYIPTYIIDKFKSKKMSITHFSDIYHFALLATHGGLWIDATVFVGSPIPKSIFEIPYYTIHCNNDFSSVLGKWTGFLQSSYANSIVPKFCQDVLFAYWEKFDTRIDYLQIDYFMHFGYDFIPMFRRLIESVPLKNDIYDLFNNANNAYSEKLFNKIMKNSTFFKMSWKVDFQKEINGHDTIYGYLEKKFLYI